eukprot:2100693-Alexandrium_andersonii.AAC.1
MISNKALLNSLYSMQTNLSFSAVMMKKAVHAHATSKAASWEFSAGDCAEFASETSGKIRNLCRFGAQNLRKQKTPGWLSNVFDHLKDVRTSNAQATASAIESEDEGDGEDGEDDVEYYVGWNSELRAAWRCAAEDIDAYELLCLPSLAPQNSRCV